VRGPALGAFFFRAYTERLMAPGNGTASRDLARIVERELLGGEPYKSNGIDLETFFESGSLRMFEDLASLDGYDRDRLR
jgi:hypothetical protein